MDRDETCSKGWSRGEDNKDGNCRFHSRSLIQHNVLQIF
jgi:hypothetical protein